LSANKSSLLRGVDRPARRGKRGISSEFLWKYGAAPVNSADVEGKTVHEQGFDFAWYLRRHYQSLKDIQSRGDFLNIYF
jgi:hypothetical protein